MRKMNIGRLPAMAVLFAASATLAACDESREAEAETPVAEAEVGTELPETVVSDEQLQATADAAAEVASQPVPDVVAVPVPAEGASQTNQAQPSE